MKQENTEVEINENFYINPKEADRFAKETVENLVDLNPAVVKAKNIIYMHDLNQRLKKADYERKKKNY